MNIMLVRCKREFFIIYNSFVEYADVNDPKMIISQIHYVNNQRKNKMNNINFSILFTHCENRYFEVNSPLDKIL